MSKSTGAGRTRPNLANICPTLAKNGRTRTEFGRNRPKMVELDPKLGELRKFEQAQIWNLDEIGPILFDAGFELGRNRAKLGGIRANFRRRRPEFGKPGRNSTGPCHWAMSRILRPTELPGGLSRQILYTGPFSKNTRSLTPGRNQPVQAINLQTAKPRGCDFLNDTRLRPRCKRRSGRQYRDVGKVPSGGRGAGNTCCIVCAYARLASKWVTCVKAARPRTRRHVGRRCASVQGR